MFGHKKLPEDVTQYANVSVTASNNWAKFKKTRKTKYKNRAKRDYAIKDALEIKMATPSTNVKTTNNNLTFKNSFNKTKSTKVKTTANVNTKVKKSKK